MKKVTWSQIDSQNSGDGAIHRNSVRRPIPGTPAARLGSPTVKRRVMVWLLALIVLAPGCHLSSTLLASQPTPPGPTAITKTAAPVSPLVTRAVTTPAPDQPEAGGLSGLVGRRAGLPFDHYNYTDLGGVANLRQIRYCGMTAAQWEAYYQAQNAQALDLSARLEDYIRAWMAGQAAPELPQGLLPPSMDNAKTNHWRLLRPEEVEPETQWYIRPAHEIPADFSQLHFLGPDNHVTYAKLIFVSPLGAQLLVEGDFPHARFMDYQILEPFDPRFATTAGLGAPEVPIVDVDITPDPGHTNPFRAGADRNAIRRHYTLTFDLAAGNALELNPLAMRQPEYRAPGNTRVGGPFASSGPLGDGQIVPSVLWLRYYAPDKAAGPLGGVPLPKALLRLNTGETFWLQPDITLVEERQNMAVPGIATAPRDPARYLGPTVGWFKMFGFWLTYADGMAYPWVRPWGPLPKTWAESLLARLDRCFFGRSAQAVPIGNYELSASGMNYNTYLFRVMDLGRDKVYALTGRLPVTPKTRSGEAAATTGEARYWSLCHTGNGEDGKYPSLLYGCLMDDEVTATPEHDYVLVYSRAADRPRNARPECGVTWQDYGPESRQVFVLRWTSVMPDDYFPEYAPHLPNIPWETGEWSQPSWDRSLIGYNTHDGVMGAYQPLVHYLDQAEFEALGCPIAAEAVPEWK